MADQQTPPPKNDPPPPAPEMRHVEFGGMNLRLPAEYAEALKGERQILKEGKDQTGFISALHEAVTEERKRLKSEIGALAGRLGEHEAARKAAEDRAKREVEDKEAIKLAADGKVEALRQMMSADSESKLAVATAKLNAATAKMIRSAIAAEVARNVPHLDAVAQGDMVALISGSVRPSNDDPTRPEIFSADGSPALRDGKPATLDGYVADFIAARKHLQPANVPPPTGGKGTPATQTQGKTVTSEQWRAMAPREQGAFIKAGGSIAN